MVIFLLCEYMGALWGARYNRVLRRPPSILYGILGNCDSRVYKFAYVLSFFASNAGPTPSSDGHAWED